jgi:hypothetical protein
MWATIASWAANKIAVAVVAVAALCGVIFTPVALYQAFEINGYQILWWGAPGLKAQLKTARDSLGQCHGNVDGLETAVAKQNTKILALGKQGDVLRAALADVIAKNQTEREALLTRLAVLAAAKPAGANECERAISARAQIIEDRSR